MTKQQQGFRFFLVVLSLSFFAFSSMVRADITLHVGPAATGGGGPNPISVPPLNPVEYELVWLTKNQTEWSIGIVPGLFYGFRTSFQNGTYVSLGGGLAVSSFGAGPGVYAAFGYNNCDWVCFNIEYKKAVGVLRNMLIDPYAIRIGTIFFRN